MNTQDWFLLGWTGWISLQSKGLSRVFSNTTVQKHQYKGAKIIVIWRSLLKCQLACSDAVEMVMSCILGLLLPGPCLPLLCHLLPWPYQSLLIFAQCQSVHFKSPCAHSWFSLCCFFFLCQDTLTHPSVYSKKPSQNFLAKLRTPNVCFHSFLCVRLFLHSPVLRLCAYVSVS